MFIDFRRDFENVVLKMYFWKRFLKIYFW